jgi:hypothetical protein
MGKSEKILADGRGRQVEIPETVYFFRCGQL